MEERSGGERQLVVFDLANELYGINIGTVREIIRQQAVTCVPDSPSFVEGVLNLRGRITPVVDLRKRFGLPAAASTDRTRVLVVDIRGNDIGVVVDAVTEVQRIAESAIEPVSGVVATAESYYIDGIAKLGDRLLILLDLDRALGAAIGDVAAGGARAA